jgi:hypothetical protein
MPKGFDAFEAMVARTDVTKKFSVRFDYCSDAVIEMGAFIRKSGRIIARLTMRENLDEQLTRKLA